MIKKLTQKYINSFSNKDLTTISYLLTDDFVLEDPVVKRVEGKEASLNVIKDIFDSCNNIDFSAKNIFIDNNISIIEFILDIDDTRLTGVDIIEWDNNKIKELKAYLDIPCTD